MNDGGMNEWLADFYGTDGHTDAEELEKAAQAALLEKLAEEGDLDIDSLTDDEVVELAESLGISAEEEVEEFVEEKTSSVEEAEELDEQLEFISKVASTNDIDLDQLSDEDLEGFAAHVLDPATWEDEEAAVEMSDHEKISMINKVAESNEIDIDDLDEEQFQELAEFALDPENWADEGEVKEAEAKFAEADFLGRVMAHAQFSELRKIAEEEELGKEASKAAQLKERLLAMLAQGKEVAKAPGRTYGKERKSIAFRERLMGGGKSEKAQALEALRRAAKKHPGQAVGAGAAVGGGAALAAS